MSQDVVIDPLDDRNFVRTASNSGPVLGQWYWVIPDHPPTKDEHLYSVTEQERLAESRQEWLGCATRIGSNFVEITGPGESYRFSRKARVHIDSFWTQLRLEPNADAQIDSRIKQFQEESIRLMAEVQAVTQRLGMTPQEAIAQGEGGSSGAALMVLSGTHDVKEYGRELVLAKEKTLPALFAAIKDANENLATWMKAPSLPMMASLHHMEKSVKGIDDRIFSVTLYAGLTEQVVQCCDGAPAAIDEKLHVMQRRAYMDEECLMSYRHGGMEFNEIGAFDAFMAEPQNRNRILPHARCMVAMRVRRFEKQRDNMDSLSQTLINLRLGNQDKLTFLYIRNGEQVWRLSCDLDFGSSLFPDKSMFDPGEAKMVRNHGFGRVDDFMTVSEWQERSRAQSKAEADGKAWADANPGKHAFSNPFRHTGAEFRAGDWQPIDHLNLYFDEAMKAIEEKIKAYNRIALIIQGLFDRSMVLHPHLPVQTWTAAGFDRAVKLVYDGSDVLHNGEAPDFEAYRDRCNASFGPGSLAAGQDDFWERKEAEKESRRRDNDWRDKSSYRPERFRPRGNPGPGEVATVVRWSPRKRDAGFTWQREKQTESYPWQREMIDCTLSVPASELLNVSAYRLGDFRQFFQDPRTREQYLKWAPLLLLAEEYVAKHGAVEPTDELDDGCDNEAPGQV